MARQTRKIKRKLAPAVEEKSESNSLKPKEGRDRLLLVLMAVTALIMILGISSGSMDSIGIGLYSTMMGAMICLYFSRHGNLGEQIQKNLRYASFAFIAAVILLMIANFYYNISW